MIIDEFEHYFRLCMPRTLDKEESRQFLFAVNDIVEAEADAEDVVMVYHEDEGMHCYDVRLGRDITAEEGDEILFDLEDLFPDDDFECESSMDKVEENLYLNRAILEQLNQKLV